MSRGTRSRVGAVAMFGAIAMIVSGCDSAESTPTAADVSPVSVQQEDGLTSATDEPTEAPAPVVEDVPAPAAEVAPVTPESRVQPVPQAPRSSRPNASSRSTQVAPAPAPAPAPVPAPTVTIVVPAPAPRPAPAPAPSGGSGGSVGITIDQEARDRIQQQEMERYLAELQRQANQNYDPSQNQIGN